MQTAQNEKRGHYLRFTGLLLVAIAAFFAFPILEHGNLALDGLDRANNLLMQELGSEIRLEDNRFAYQDTAPWQTLGPADHFAIKEIGEGRLPLWSPNVAMGWPVFASGSAAPLSPFKIPLYLVPGPTGMTLYLVLKVFGCGFFTYLLLRRLRRSRIAATFGALGYAFCGYSIGYLPFHHDPIALFPLLLYLGESLLRKPGTVQSINLGLIAALTLYSGHITVAVLTLSATGFYIALRKSIGAWTHGGVLRGCSVALTLCFLLSAPFTFPMLEFLQHGWSYKTNLSEEVDESSAEREMGFGLRRFATSIVPNLKTAYKGETRIPGGAGLFAQNPVDGTPRYRSFLYAYLGAFGGLTWVLAFFYLVSRPRAPVTRGMNQPRRTLLIFVLAPAFVAFAFPGSSLFAHLPIFGAILPRYFLSWLAIALVIAAAHGVDEILLDNSRYRNFIICAALYALLVLGFCALYGEGLNPESPLASEIIRIALTPLIPLVIGAVLLSLRSRKGISGATLGKILCILLWIELFIHGGWISGAPQYQDYSADKLQNYLGSSYRPEDRSAALGDTLWPNTAIYAGLNEAQGILPLFVHRYRRFMESAEPAMKGLYPTSAMVREPNEMLDLASISRYLAPVRWQAPKESERVVYEGKKIRVLSRDALPRAYLSTHFSIGKNPEETLTEIRNDPQNAKIRPWVEPQSDQSVQELKKTAARANPPRIFPATIERYGSQEVLIRLPENQHGVLVFTDIYYPGWRAEVDGRDTPVFPANYAFRAVHIREPGERIRFYYDPFSLRLGLFFLLGGLIFIALLVYRAKAQPRATP